MKKGANQGAAYCTMKTGSGSDPIRIGYNKKWINKKTLRSRSITLWIVVPEVCRVWFFHSYSAPLFQKL